MPTLPHSDKDPTRPKEGLHRAVKMYLKTNTTETGGRVAAEPGSCQEQTTPKKLRKPLFSQTLHKGCVCYGFAPMTPLYIKEHELGFNDTSTLVGHFVSSPREREKRDRRDSRGDQREGQGRQENE